jgi:hypothetical protein
MAIGNMGNMLLARKHSRMFVSLIVAANGGRKLV